MTNDTLPDDLTREQIERFRSIMSDEIDAAYDADVAVRICDQLLRSLHPVATEGQRDDEDRLVSISLAGSTHTRKASEWLALARADLLIGTAPTAATVSVPDGWKLVPMLETEDMQDSARGILQILRGRPGCTENHVYEHCEARGDSVAGLHKNDGSYVTEARAVAMIYRAMLAAAPAQGQAGDPAIAASVGEQHANADATHASPSSTGEQETPLTDAFYAMHWPTILKEEPENMFLAFARNLERVLATARSDVWEEALDAAAEVVKSLLHGVDLSKTEGSHNLSLAPKFILALKEIRARGRGK